MIVDDRQHQQTTAGQWGVGHCTCPRVWHGIFPPPPCAYCRTLERQLQRRWAQPRMAPPVIIVVPIVVERPARAEVLATDE